MPFEKLSLRGCILLHHSKCIWKFQIFQFVTRSNFQSHSRDRVLLFCSYILWQNYLLVMCLLFHLSCSSAAAASKSLQSCPTLCDPIDGSPPGSPVPWILQARTLEWVAISFSNAWKWKVKVKSLSRVQLLATPWTAAYQAPPSMGFSRREYWSGVALPSLISLLYVIISFHQLVSVVMYL